MLIINVVKLPKFELMKYNCFPETVAREVELDEDDESFEGGGIDARHRAVAQVHLLKVDQPRRPEGALRQRAQRVPAHAQYLK